MSDMTMIESLATIRLHDLYSFEYDGEITNVIMVLGADREGVMVQSLRGATSYWMTYRELATIYLRRPVDSDWLQQAYYLATGIYVEAN